MTMQTAMPDFSDRATRMIGAQNKEMEMYMTMKRVIQRKVMKTRGKIRGTAYTVEVKVMWLEVYRDATAKTEDEVAMRESMKMRRR